MNIMEKKIKTIEFVDGMILTTTMDGRVYSRPIDAFPLLRSVTVLPGYLTEILGKSRTRKMVRLSYSLLIKSNKSYSSNNSSIETPSTFPFGI